MISAYHRAGFPCLWVETAEPDRTTREAREELQAEQVPTFTWDLLRGVRDASGHQVAGGGTDPIQALDWLCGTAPEPCVLAASLLHRLTGSAEVQQALLTGAAAWKATQRMLVVLAPPGVRPPLELERVCHVVEQPLPAAWQLQVVVERLAAENEGIRVPDPAAVGEALRGLTEAEAENVAALAAVRDAGEVRAEDVWGETATVIRTSSGGALELRQPAGSFELLGGLARLKAYAGRAIRSPLSRGIILLGVPGGGKTVFALALGAEVKRPVYLLDVGRLFASHVGESEAMARRATGAVDAAGRCILLVDEIEKGCAGMGGSGESDSGVTARTMGHLLTWLSDRKPGGAYVIGTCNDVSKLPPEMTRAGRWDATFFVDLPSLQQREAIYQIHAKRHGVVEPFPAGLTDGWTGAEIENLCVQAELLGGATLAEAAGYVVPLSRSRGEEIQALRTWAQGRCVPADAPAEPTTKSRRVRGLSEN